MTSKSNTRLEWIDILKGFLLTCICFSHFNWLPVPLTFFIQPTGDVWVPAFFFLSGLLFSENKYPLFKEFLKSKVRSLLIPYLFFFFLFLILDWNLYLKTPTIADAASNALLYAGGPPKAGPLWFVIKLFEINLLYFFMLRITSLLLYRLLIVLLCSFAGYLLYFYKINLPFGIEVLLSSVAFFGVAHLLKGHIFKCVSFFEKQSFFKGLLPILLLATIAVFAGFYNGDAVLGQNKINNYFLFYLTSIPGILSVTFLSALVWQKASGNVAIKKIFSFFRYIALYALPILASHCYVMITMDVLLGHLHLSLLIGFIIKIGVIITAIYFFIVPLCYSQLYFILGKTKSNWNNFIFK